MAKKAAAKKKAAKKTTTKKTIEVTSTVVTGRRTKNVAPPLDWSEIEIPGMAGGRDNPRERAIRERFRVRTPEQQAQIDSWPAKPSMNKKQVAELKARLLK